MSHPDFDAMIDDASVAAIYQFCYSNRSMVKRGKPRNFYAGEAPYLMSTLNDIRNLPEVSI